MTLEINIREMTGNEVEYIARETIGSGIGELYFGSDLDKLVQILSALSEGEKVYVACVDEAIVGYIWFGLRGVFRIHPYVHMHFVRTDMRGRGIGASLLDAFEKSAEPVSGKAFLAVAEFNYKAASLYERKGYRSVGCIPGLYREGVSENLYMKDLRNPAVMG